MIPRGIEDAAPYNFPGTPDRVVGADAYIRPRYALPFHCRGDVGIAPYNFPETPYNFPETSVRVVGADAYIRPRYTLPFHCRGDVGIAPYNFPETSVRVVGAGSPGPG